MAVTMKYNGQNLRFGGRVIPLCDSRPFPEFKASTSTIDGADGEWLDAQTIGRREFTITLVTTDAVKSSLDIQALARDIGRVLMVREPKDFTFSDELDPNDKKTQLVRKAVPTGTFDVEEFAKAGRWTCRFKMPDPFLHGKKHVEIVNDGTQRTYQVGGNAPAKLKATAISKDGKPSYQLIAQNGSIVYKANFTGEQTITLDFEKQTAKVTGNIGDGLTTGSVFFPWEGTMTVKSIGANTTLTWWERWL